MPESASFHSKGYHRYFEGYTEHTVTLPDGKTKVERIYTGILHKADVPLAKRDWIKRSCLLLFLMSAVCFLLSAVQYVGSNSCWYVGITQAFSIVGFFFLFYYLVGFETSGEELTLYEYKGILAFQKAALFTAFALSCVTATTVLYTILHHSEGFMTELICILSTIAAAACCFAIHYLEKNITYRSYLSPNAIPEDGNQIES